MKSTLSLVVLAAGFALAGCSSTPSKVDSGAIQARSFNFVVRKGQPIPDYADKREVIHPMIQTAITKNLAGKGVNQVASNGDVTVGYLIIVGNNASTTSVNDYFGYGQEANALHEKAHDAYTGSKNPNYFEAGTLVIDVVDNKTFKLLKRSWTTRPILRNVPDDARAARLQEVVDEILKDLRVAK